MLMAVALAANLAAAAAPADNDGRIAPAAPPIPKRPIRIKLEGMITPLTKQFLFERLEQARSLGSDLVIVDIDSPGGHLESSLDIANHLRDLDWARTVAYIPRQALSGAAFAALACEEIQMKPLARLGDAGPIILGEDSLFRHAPEKIVSDLALQLRSLAEAKGRPPALAEAMVNRNLEVFEVRAKETGDIRYLSDAEIAQLADPEKWERGKLVFESRKDHFLEVTGKRAVELGLANSTVKDLPELLEREGIEGDPPLLEQTWADTTVAILNHPFITAILLIVGLVCLYIELHIPGFGLAGLASGLCFVLFFWSRILGGTSGWLEVVLFVAGIVCLGIELFLMPGVGIAGVTGVLLMLASVVLASQTFVIPRTNYDFEVLGSTAGVLVASGVVFVGISVFLGRYFESLPIFRRMVLAPPGATPISAGSPETPARLPGNKDWLLERTGVATTFLRPAGKAAFGEEIVDVVAEGSFIDPNRPVRVISVQGNRVVVRET